MEIITTARTALRTLWTHKYLWLFGFFVAAGSGSSGGEASSNGAPAGAGVAAGTLPAWLPVVVAAGIVLGLFTLVAHVVSEGALIDAVDREQRGTIHSLRTGIGAGLGHFWRVLGVKAAIFAISALSMALMAVPVGLVVAEILPVWAGVLVALPLLVVGVPWLLTLYFVKQHALRFAVVDAIGVRPALTAARRFLHGRIGLSLRLLVADGLGRALVSAAGAVVILLVGGLLGGPTYLAAGLVPAIVAAAVAVVPLACVLAGITGSYGSSVWTLGFVEERGL